MSPKDTTHAVEDALDDLNSAAEDSDRVSVGDAAEALGHHGFGPLLFVPALLELTPIGTVPGVPTLLALIISIVAVQIVMGRDHFWLPHILERQSVSARKVRSAVDTLHGPAQWLDRRFGQRLTGFTGSVALRAAGAVILVLCAAVPFLEFVPWASSAPMAAIAVLGLAMTVRDGLAMLLGFVAAVAGLSVGIGLLTTTFG